MNCADNFPLLDNMCFSLVLPKKSAHTFPQNSAVTLASLLCFATYNIFIILRFNLQVLVKNRKANRKLVKPMGDHGFDLRFYGVRLRLLLRLRLRSPMSTVTRGLVCISMIYTKNV